MGQLGCALAGGESFPAWLWLAQPGLRAGMGSGSMYWLVVFIRINVVLILGCRRGLAQRGDSHLAHSAELPSCTLSVQGGACGIKVQPNGPGDPFPS